MYSETENFGKGEEIGPNVHVTLIQMGKGPQLTAKRRKGFAYLVIFSSSLSLGSTAKLFSYISCTYPAACILLRI